MNKGRASTAWAVFHETLGWSTRMHMIPPHMHPPKSSSKYVILYYNRVEARIFRDQTAHISSDNL